MHTTTHDVGRLRRDFYHLGLGQVFIQGRLGNIYYKCTDGWIKLVLRSTSFVVPHTQTLCRNRGVGKVTLLLQGDRYIRGVTPSTVSNDCKSDRCVPRPATPVVVVTSKSAPSDTLASRSPCSSSHCSGSTPSR